MEVKAFEDRRGLRCKQDHPNLAGAFQWLYEFENGYTASVVSGSWIFDTSEDGPFELAVKVGDYCVYDTPITDSVVGYLTEQGVLELLDKIEALPVRQ